MMLLCNKVLFELPVYRLTENKYYKQFAVYKVKHGNAYTDDSYLLKEYGGSWEYNEIIGYLKFYLSGNTQIRSVYTETDAKKKVKTRKKTFIETTHSFCTTNINRKLENQKIIKFIEDSITHCALNLPKGRFIKRDIFDSTFKHIDWQSVMA